MATIKLRQAKGYDFHRKQEVYFVRTREVGTIGKEDLVRNISREGMIPRGYVAAVLDMLMPAVFDYMKAGMAVQVPGLGTLKLNVRSKAQATREQATAYTVQQPKIQLILTEEVKREMAQFHYEVVEE